MKIFGSNRGDTLVGTTAGDTVKALGGDDLIATAGGIDTILAGSGNDMITGFSFTLTAGTDGGGGTGGIGVGGRANSGKSVFVDGGDGSHDVMLVELTAAKGLSLIDTFREKASVRNVEEFIYNFSSLSADQKIQGSNNTRSIETIVVGSGTANIDARSGDDYIYTATGNDAVKGGGGSDFIHAGEGHNIVSGGAGEDYFHFELTDSYQYTEITDFQPGEDKILINVPAEQINLVFSFADPNWQALEPDGPVRTYGDWHQGVGSELNGYVSYNFGREFDPSQFAQNAGTLYQPLWATYDQDTGSIFARHYETTDAGPLTTTVLVAHVAPGTQLDLSDILFLMV